MVEFIAASKRLGIVKNTYSALGKDLQSKEVNRLELTYEGIVGDRHWGLTRKSNSREPWYKKGTRMRNEQQLSIISSEEMKEIAKYLNIEQLRGEWIGANICLEGIAHLSLLPPRTLLMFEGGVTIRVDGDRGPCRVSGRSLAAQFEGRGDLEFLFPKVAKHRRGLVGWVEIPGTIEAGESVTARIWEQCIYPG